MEDLSGQSFVPINSGRVDEEMIPTARGVSQVLLNRILREKKFEILCNFILCYTRAFGDGPHVILNHGQVTWTTPELAPPLLTTTPHQREDVSALDRFSVHRCPTRWVFSGTGLELVTKPATIRCLYHSATAALNHLGKMVVDEMWTGKRTWRNV
ncbi:uncharacterized protein TNCV_27931 [Trichonephila clavipes]|uniref:Uncharacterized protein n=1 Tax=Trichonephila clavipes TaxID=2585209 RepID=A0A8X7BMI7_TRICX|nr:uncharacterized protein TNCV_27931 [Trichonephila clavipes]